MAHFAKLNSSNIVEAVYVVDNNITTSNGLLGENDMHIDGEKWCQDFWKHPYFKQTSYNNKFRKQFASIGDSYDPINNLFIKRQLYASWSLDSNFDWQAPIVKPTTDLINIDGIDKGLVVRWNEADQKWTAVLFENVEIAYNWNAQTLTWELANV
jgi:hypothetical protein